MRFVVVSYLCNSCFYVVKEAALRGLIIRLIINYEKHISIPIRLIECEALKIKEVQCIRIQYIFELLIPN